VFSLHAYSIHKDKYIALAEANKTFQKRLNCCSKTFNINVVCIVVQTETGVVKSLILMRTKTLTNRTSDRKCV